jgi:hypothetical protein
MMTLTIPADLEGVLAQAAQQRGMAVERLALETLRERFALESAAPTGGATLFDLLADGIGAVDGSPEAWSERCGERFADGLSVQRP